MQPCVILVESQLAENIGMVARAMLNCGLTDLRLVRPQTRWPHPRAAETSSGADEVVNNARVFETVADAAYDVQFLLACTARGRELAKPIVTAREAAHQIHQHQGQGMGCGLLFGPERSGLANSDLNQAHTLVTVPLNPAFTSLNLAQAVLLLAYEYRMAADQTPAEVMDYGRSQPVSVQEMDSFLLRLEEKLDDCGFLRIPEKRQGMIDNIRTMFTRIKLSGQEVRTLQGILTELTSIRYMQRKVHEAAMSSETQAPAEKLA